jgi:hypothetical protein
MQRYPREEALQEAACMAFRHLVAQNAANQLRAHMAGALPAVLAALAEHRKSEDVSAAACAALWELTCRNKTVQDAAERENAVEAVVATMRTHPGSNAVQDAACAALQNLAFKHEPSRCLAACCCALEVVVTAMRRFPQSPHVQGSAAGALWSIVGDSEELREQAKAAGAVEVLETAIINFGMPDRAFHNGKAQANESVQDHVHGALSILRPGQTEMARAQRRGVAAEDLRLAEADRLKATIENQWLDRVARARARNLAAAAAQTQGSRGVARVFSTSAGCRREFHSGRAAAFPYTLPLAVPPRGAVAMTSQSGLALKSARSVVCALRTLAR